MSGSRTATKPRQSPGEVARNDALRTRQRIAQRGGNSDNCVNSNLTEFGADFHDIIPGTLLTVKVFENGIWIQPTNGGEQNE